MPVNQGIHNIIILLIIAAEEATDILSAYALPLTTVSKIPVEKVQVAASTP